VSARRYPLVDLQRGIARHRDDDPASAAGRAGRTVAQNPKPDGCSQVLTEFFKVSGEIQCIEAAIRP
jgi:hypothetical protein